MNYLRVFTNNLSDKKIFIIFLIFGFLIYGNALFNSFAADDFPLVVNNTLVHELNVTKFFTSGSFNDEGSGEGNNYFKPVFPTIISYLYLTGSGQPFIFHFTQVVIHIINSFLFFLLFKKVFSNGLAVFLSIVFLVHPINTEAVSYISAFQDVLFQFFGLLGICLAMKTIKNKYYFVGLISSMSVLSALSKETGILYLILTPIFIWVFKKEKIRLVLISESIALSIYIFLRFFISNIHINQTLVVPIMKLPLEQRILNIPLMVYFYLKTFIFPKDLIMFQSWVVKDISFQNFYLPSLFVLSLFGLCLFLIIYVYKKTQERKIFLLFFIWFFCGLGAHLQIVPLDETVSDRWFYFPIIGLLGLFGIVFSARKLNNRQKKVAILLGILIIIMLSVRVIVRNTDWKNDETLITHDSKLNPASYQIQDSLGAISYRNKDYLKAEEHYVYSTKLFPTPLTYGNLGYFYFLTGKKQKSKDAYYTSLKYGGSSTTYYNLSFLLLELGKIMESERISQIGIKKFPNYWGTWLTYAMAQYLQGEKQKALISAERADSLGANDSTALILDSIRKDKKINL